MTVQNEISEMTRRTRWREPGRALRNTAGNPHYRTGMGDLPLAPEGEIIYIPGGIRLPLARKPVDFRTEER
jgi:hypothetical protein